jgi:hypothetical protein
MDIAFVPLERNAGQLGLVMGWRNGRGVNPGAPAFPQLFRDW